MQYVIELNNRSQQGVRHIEFPTGERHLRVPELLPSYDVVIDCRGQYTDIMKLGLAVDICRRSHVNSISLVLPFVPYARQDQVYVDGDPLSIKVFATFVNSLGFDRVIIVDPHSKVTEALFDRVCVIPQHRVASYAAIFCMKQPRGDLSIVAPDLGAAKKIKDLQSHILQGIGKLVPVIQCDKTRDPKTGRITGFRILDGEVTGHLLVVDDICDGGGTFMGLAEVLKDAQTLSLCVTHGVFSKGTEELGCLYRNIFASASILQEDHIHSIYLQDLINEQLTTAN